LRLELHKIRKTLLRNFGLRIFTCALGAIRDARRAGGMGKKLRRWRANEKQKALFVSFVEGFFMGGWIAFD